MSISAALLYGGTISASETPHLLPSGHLPPEFIDEPFSEGWTAPTSFAFDPEGNLYVAERGGRIWRIPSNPQVRPGSPFLDLSDEVTTSNDFGLLSVTLDPDFLYNGFLYASYTVSPRTLFGGRSDESDPTMLRVVRYTADPQVDFAKAQAGSRRVLLGDKPGSGPAILAGANPGGGLAFGTDGSLLISTGDGASPRSADAGSDAESKWQIALDRSLIRPDENIGAFRAQSLNSLAGKILRVDPESGAGFPSNPYYDEQNPRSPRSLVWSLGLRNPFRLAVKPNSGGRYPTDGDPGTIAVGDVGWASAEEVNLVAEGARNFGWPLFEGLVSQTAFSRLDTRNPDAIDREIDPEPIAFRHLIIQATEDPNPVFPHPASYGQKISPAFTHVHRRPVLEYRDAARTGITRGDEVSEVALGAPGSPVEGHSAPGSCSIAGTWFDGLGYPATYRDSYFHADFRGGWIQQLMFAPDGSLTHLRPFLSSARQIIQLDTHPKEGILYYLDHAGGDVRRIRFTGEVNLPPIARATQSAVFGPSPLTVHFDASLSSDPEGSPLRYRWDFGDGATSSDPHPTHVFTGEEGIPTAFPVTLTVTDPKGLQSFQNLTVSVNNTPPRIRITSFHHGALYEENAGDTGPATIPLRAEVADLEHRGDVPSALSYRWQLILHHNKHTHELPPSHDVESSAVLPATPCGFDAYAYRVLLTVTDAAGLSSSVQSWLYPDCPCLNRATAEVWRLGHFDPTQLELAGRWDADPDKDGLCNLLEYALGRLPNSPDAPGSDPMADPILTVEAPPPGSKSTHSISYHRPEWQPDVSYTLDLSADGQTWFTLESRGEKFLPSIHPTSSKGVERVVYGSFDPLPIPPSGAWARLRVHHAKSGTTAFGPPVRTSP